MEALRQDLHLCCIPGIEDFNAQSGEVLHVARDECKVVFYGRCGNHTVRSAERRSVQQALPIQRAPAVGDGAGDWQDTPVKSRQQVIFEPPLQIGTPLARRKRNKSSTQFADRHNAQVERLFVLCVYPISYEWVGTSCELVPKGR